jgi:hypothetical protein
MMKANSWNVIYWNRGESQSSAVVLNHEPLTYKEARSQAKRCRFIPGFGGYVVSVEPSHLRNYWDKYRAA